MINEFAKCPTFIQVSPEFLDQLFLTAKENLLIKQTYMVLCIISLGMKISLLSDEQAPYLM